MARLWQSGAELNSATTGVEFFTVSGSPTIDSTIKRSGSYSIKIASLVSGTAKGVLHKFVSSTNPGPYWARGYLYIVTLPSASNHIMSFNSSSGTAGTSDRGKITLESDGTLILRDSAGNQIGSASSALSLNTWYMVELKMDRTPASGSRITEGRLNGSVFATSSTQTDANNLAVSWGGNFDLEAQTQGEWYWDDLAINDNSGSLQNSYPGSGKIIHLKPNASGDANAWLDTAGSAGTTNNYTLVDEVTPNDATDFIQSTTLNDQDMYNVENSGIAAGDTVNTVGVYSRNRNDTADTAIGFKLQIVKTSGGTITQGTEVIPNTTTWRMHNNTEPRNYMLMTHTDPDAAAWTQSTLDTMQIGAKITTDGTNKIQITALQASVDYTPASGIDVTVSAGVQSKTINLLAPSVSISDSNTPSVFSITVNLPAPTVTTTRNPTVTADVQSKTINLLAPTITAVRNVSISPSVLSKTINLLTPAFVGPDVNVTVTPKVLEIGRRTYIYDLDYNLYKRLFGDTYIKL